MEVLLILAVVVGVAVGVGFTTWQLSWQVKSISNSVAVIRSQLALSNVMFFYSPTSGPSNGAAKLSSCPSGSRT